MTDSHSLQSQRLDGLLDFDKRIFFLVMVILFLIVRLVTNDIILESIPGYEALESEGSLSYFHIFNTLSYIWTPFAFLWKFTLIAFLIWMSSFALGFKSSFRVIWQVVMLAELIFLLPELIKMIYFLSPSSDVTYLDIKTFYPLSALAFVDVSQINTKYIYPLQLINLFEIIYIFVLSKGFQLISKRPLKESLGVILVGYVFFLILWGTFYILTYR